jgi:hypothetical protein
MVADEKSNTDNFTFIFGVKGYKERINHEAFYFVGDCMFPSSADDLLFAGEIFSNLNITNA